MGEESGTAQVGGVKKPGEVVGVGLSDRDVELVKCLVEARCLSREQLMRLFWPGREVGGVRKRLSLLVRGEVLSPLAWYDRGGAHLAYGLGPRGVREAEAMLNVDLDAAREDISASHIEHHLLMSELFVGLLAAPLDVRIAKEGTAPKRKGGGGPHARVEHPGFTWQVTGDIEMPWRQAVSGALESRVLRPDAVMLVPSQKRRIFVESETGSHSIATSNAQRFGATINKMERYEAYCSTGSGNGSTWYATRYTDGFKPEVLFLVPTAARRDNVKTAIAGWMKKHTLAACRFRVSLVAEEVKALSPVVWAGYTPPKPAEAKPAEPAKFSSAFSVSPEEAVALRAFYDAVAKELKEKRNRAEALKQPKPPWPEGSHTVAAVLKRFQEERAKQPKE